jgi:type II secretory pathway component PulJ
MIISEERVRARRAALVAQMAEAQQQYAQLEQTLQQLGRISTRCRAGCKNSTISWPSR